MGNWFTAEKENGEMNEPVKTGMSYIIGGVKVDFPAKAYPSQLSMMDKVIRGCHRAQNCLLESPTGSGKTLALLCGAVAWQKAEVKRIDEEHAKLMEEYRLKVQEISQKQKTAVQEEVESENDTDDESVLEPLTVKHEIVNLDSDDEDVFRPSKKYKITSLESAKPEMCGRMCGPEHVAVLENSTITRNNSDEKKTNQNSNCLLPSEPKKPRAPQIYFGTRTHKQIAQIVKELRRTVYNDINITVLSSRAHSCVMEDRSRPFINKNDLCKELLDPRQGSGCQFKYNVKTYSHHTVLMNNELPKIWDLEDLIKFGNKKTVCPYFLARELLPSSNVIFCPYNYIIDPLIRKSMNINLKGSILILDEAHNIEDSCREAGSLSITQDQIIDALRDCEEAVEYSECKAPFHRLIQILNSLSLWIDQHKNDINDVTDYDQSKLTMFGPQAVESFKDYEFGPEKYRSMEEALHCIEAEKENQNQDENKDIPSLSGNTKNLCEGLILVLGFLYDEQYTFDYHVALMKTFNHNYFETPEADSEGWIDRRKKNKVKSRWSYTLSFWCLNPATVFLEIGKTARCIILTSGTLSPMDSFQSELGTQFPNKLEANHIIRPEQCWIGSVGRGPNRIRLDGTYKSTSTWEFQEEVGQILLNICSLVPHGVLCFVPSYTLLDKLRERWNVTGTLAKISKHKLVVWEPRRGDELESLMDNFYKTISNTATVKPGDGVTGVLFVAVCRGKVSEGLDFADKNARAVVTIGIPFPSIKDSQVMLKQSYNDKHQHRGLLSGRDWYQIQAYRALNQALGRCIRHRDDWGAILLIDSRFSNNSYYKGLSKWVRNKVNHHDVYEEMIDHLSRFIQSRLQIDEIKT